MTQKGQTDTFKSYGFERFHPIFAHLMYAPNQCIGCNRVPTVSDERFADLLTDIDNRIHVYLCYECCVEIATLINYTNGEELSKVVNALSDLQTRNRNLNAQVKTLKGILDDKLNDLPDCPVCSTDLSSELNSSVVTSSKDVERLSDIDEILEGRESGSTKSVKSE